MTQTTAEEPTREVDWLERDEQLKRIVELISDPVALAEALYTTLRERRALDPSYKAAAAVCSGLVAVLADLPKPAKG